MQANFGAVASTYTHGGTMGLEGSKVDKIR